MTTPQTPDARVGVVPARPGERVERMGSLPEAAARAAAGPAADGSGGAAAAGPHTPAEPHAPGPAGQTSNPPVDREGAGGLDTQLPPRVIGIDLSLSSTGLADSWPVIRCYTIRTSPAGDGIVERRARIRKVLYDVWTAVSRHSIIPNLVVIEGPSYNSKDGQAWDRAGLWWLVVDRFLAFAPVGIPVAVVPPAVVKKYATGKGNATKPDMRMALYQRADIDERDDNRVDAWWLTAMGLDHLGHPPVTMPAAHRAALEKVAWPEVTR